MDEHHHEDIGKRRSSGDKKMNTAEQRLKKIHDKLQELLKDHHALKKENSRMTEELHSTQRKNKEQQKNLDELKQQVSILKVSSGDMNEADKKEFEKRINGYLKEIDRCIALLGE